MCLSVISLENTNKKLFLVLFLFFEFNFFRYIKKNNSIRLIIIEHMKAYYNNHKRKRITTRRNERITESICFMESIDFFYISYYLYYALLEIFFPSYSSFSLRYFLVFSSLFFTSLPSSYASFFLHILLLLKFISCYFFINMLGSRTL